MANYKIFLCVILSLNIAGQVESQNKTDYANVLKHIFTTNAYNKKVLPLIDVGNPVYLDLSFYFLGINEINELQEKLVTTGYLWISWTDEGLQYTHTDFNDVEKVFVPQDDIWKPDIFLQNGFKKFAELGGSYYYIEVNYDGSVVWTPFDVFESRCSLDTTYYPFDKQTCSITFVVWSHSVVEVEITKSKYGIIYDEQFQENSVWEIMSISHDVSKETRESKITFTFKLRRKPLYYIVNIILPVVFLGLLNGLVFIIPADSGEKTGYSVTVFLSLAVFLTIVSTLLPVNSDKVSVLGIYLLLQVILGVIVLIITTLELRLNARNNDTPVSGIYLKVYNLKKRKCCKKKTSNEVDVLPEKQSDDEISKLKDGPSCTWGQVVSSIDFVCFWIFLTTYGLITTTCMIALTVVYY